MINQLLHGASPEERQAAVRQIGGHDWQKNPAVPSTLLLGAKNDASSVVRVECIRQIAAGQMNHPQIVSELETLTKDDDAAVRAEAAKALGQLKP
jgi:HEAT repeat protein